MGNKITTGDPIPHSVVVTVFSVHVLDMVTTCACARVCRDWLSIATKRSSHSGVIVFNHCFVAHRLFFPSSCDCDRQLLPKILRLATFISIVSLNLCNVHISRRSLRDLGDALRHHRIRPQQFMCSIVATCWGQFLLAN
jgi:hypothetical protein